MGLLITALAGFFFAIGVIISFIFKTNKNMYVFSLTLALMTLLGLIFFDLIPELFELKNHIFYGNSIIILSIIIGFLLLKILDAFIPSHSHKHREKNDNHKEHNLHLLHIGFITAISLFIHNFIEGASIYSVSLADVKSSLIMTLGVGLHNIPLGIEISQTFNNFKNNKIKSFTLLLLLIISTFLGGFTIFLFNNIINEFVVVILISITLGMTLYLIFVEILKELFNYSLTKPIFYGIIMGMILITLSLFL